MLMLLLTRMAGASVFPDISSLGESLNDLVSQPLDGLGYIPVAEAVRHCESQARWRLEAELRRLEDEGVEATVVLGSDLEARCVSYVEYAGLECVARVNSLVGELERSGRSLLSRETERCSNEVTSLSVSLTQSEEVRLGELGRQEEARLRQVYQEQGRQIEREVVADFEALLIF